jgi:hypothetical protein
MSNQRWATYMSRFSYLNLANYQRRAELNPDVISTLNTSETVINFCTPCLKRRVSIFVHPVSD